MLSWLSPGLVLTALITLVVAQLCYALWPYRRRRLGPVLVLTAAGMAAGAAWDALGLPGLHLGGAALVPAVIFAVALQPLADRWPEREP